MDKIKQQVKQIVQLIVDHPDEVETEVETREDDKGEINVIHVKTHREDIGRCIGEDGKTAEAMRRLFGLAGYITVGERVYIKVDAPSQNKVPENYWQFSE